MCKPWWWQRNIDEFIIWLCVYNISVCSVGGEPDYWLVAALAGYTPPLASWKQQISAAATKTWKDNTMKKETSPPARNRHNQKKWNSSCSVSSAETLLSHRADNNAQGWDNRKCQLIREREKQRASVMASSLFTNTLIEQKSSRALYIKVIYTHWFLPVWFFYKWNLFAAHVKWINQIKAGANPSLS